MDKPEPEWNLYRAFLAVLQAGSLSGAARELGMAQPTVGRHIDALEQALGCALFARSQHGFLPTHQALQLRPYAESLAATASAFLRAATGEAEGARGTVRVSASETVGCELLPPILARLHRAHPDLRIELALSNRMHDPLPREADIAVRLQRPEQEGLHARRVGAVELGLHAHADYLARRGAPATLAQLRGHALIGVDHETAFSRGLGHRLGELKRDDFALRADSGQARMAALRAGYGIGVCQAGLAAREPELVRLLPDLFSVKLDTWVAMHEDLRESKRCGVVYTAIADGLAAQV
ncbi:LysR family transcriptional regulator [Massilia glaciei]|uniref:LysR family transcriptional regulator n=1 Tax=Massilia glaciei TaxID=1524097 RepID=A0A2U2HP44_9BURK|nr:LysR family transcriptional regulator [Massilia glaciei]PWF49277.1 LysR family transcriptional regulator [Massilia glaciei]